MPKIRLLLYREEDGTIPLLDWLDNLPQKAVAKCRDRIDRLKEQGYELRRPLADYLRDDIYELRASQEGIHYRMLYFFHGNTAVVVSHGLVKKQIVPATEINKAIERKKKFTANPALHTYEDLSK
ncbi:MAG: type II toxin-antitoxin system RelE/ParE family toxin [Candidatus Omnitrophota bacterium]|jgi:phage-related protein|nr:MAG: type II toxin-antitoxin system RelE/ParE family toxin [Candidatus Omnitrophota bacterium]